MTEQDMRRLEGEIGGPLSPAVRVLFLNFPPELRDARSRHYPEGLGSSASG